jgi:hypothetical protein
MGWPSSILSRDEALGIGSTAATETSSFGPWSAARDTPKNFGFRRYPFVGCRTSLS